MGIAKLVANQKCLFRFHVSKADVFVAIDGSMSVENVRFGSKADFATHKTMSALPLIATVKADIAVPTEGGAFRLCPVPQTSTCSAIARASSTSMPRCRTVLSILV